MIDFIYFGTYAFWFYIFCQLYVMDLYVLDLYVLELYLLSCTDHTIFNILVCNV